MIFQVLSSTLRVLSSTLRVLSLALPVPRSKVRVLNSKGQALYPIIRAHSCEVITLSSNVITLILLDPNQRTPIQQWTFEQESTIRVGRSADNQVVLSDDLVSRHHLELRKIGYSSQGELWQLFSQGSNGTFLDGKLVCLSLLPDSSMIQLAPAGPLLRFQTKPELLAPASTPLSVEDCTHAGNHPGNLFCIHCGRPIQVQP